MSAGRERFAEVLTTAQRITRIVGDKRRDRNSVWATISWRDLDRLADALRRAGLDPHADNLGEAALERILEARGRADDRMEDFRQEHAARSLIVPQAEIGGDQ